MLENYCKTCHKLPKDLWWCFDRHPAPPPSSCQLLPSLFHFLSPPSHSLPPLFFPSWAPSTNPLPSFSWESTHPPLPPPPPPPSAFQSAGWVVSLPISTPSRLRGRHSRCTFLLWGLIRWTRTSVYHHHSFCVSYVELHHFCNLVRFFPWKRKQSPRGRGVKSPPSVNLSICSPLNIPFHDKLLYQNVLIVQRVFHGENLFISWRVQQHNYIETWETTLCGPLLPSKTWQIYWQTGVHKSRNVLPSWTDSGSSAHKRVCYY